MSYKSISYNGVFLRLWLCLEIGCLNYLLT